MLETASRCFQSASRCEGDSDEEEWLIHYMLGKIAEKRKQTPVEYLQLYKKVNSCGNYELQTSSYEFEFYLILSKDQTVF